jgi:hypothetical protein
MGGGQANSGQATTAANNADAASQQNLALSNTMGARYNQLMSQFFGSGAPGSKGTLSGFLDPNSLNVTTPTGAYKLNYENTVKQTENESRGNQANIIRQAAANGLGLSSPAIAEMARRTGLDTANLKGQDFASAVTQQHNDALQNFWGATNVASGQASGAGTGAVAGASGAGSTAANVYGTAGAYHAPAAATIAGSALEAGGAVGAAAMCPASGSKVLMADGSHKNVEDLRKGDSVRAIDGTVDMLTADPIPGWQDVVTVRTSDFAVCVSKSHWFDRSICGYVLAGDSLSESLRTQKGNQVVSEIVPGAAKERCWDLTLSPSHSYCVDGFWSLG